MTEAEWLASDDPAAMLYHAQNIYEETSAGFSVTTRTPLVSDRKLRLWAVAMYQAASRPWQGRFPPQWLDGMAATDPDTAQEEARLWGDPRADLDGDPPMAVRAALLRDIVGNAFRPARWRWGHFGARETAPGETHPPSRWWRPVWATFAGPWASALDVARAAYDDRDFALLPVLSDALEEAGCQEETLLRHLRGQECGSGAHYLTPQGPHVRGCWALDLILGKE